MRWMALVCVLMLLAAGIGEKTDHFDVKYEDMRYMKPGTDKVLENSYKAVNQYLGNLPHSIKVVVVDGEKMDEVGKHVEAFSAWNRKSSTIVLRGETLKDAESLSIVSRHELCHLGLNFLLDDKNENEYRWMEEGICMVISDEPLDDVKVSKYIASKGFLSTGEIADAVDSDVYNVTKNGYLQSYSLCKYIAKTYGIQTLIDIVKSPKTSFKDAFYDRTGVTFDSFYRDWKKQVEARSGEKSGVKVVTVKGCLDLAMSEA